MSETPDAIESLEVAEETTVTAHCCTPERTVFTEEGNSDGWIATDLTLDLER